MICVRHHFQNGESAMETDFGETRALSITDWFACIVLWAGVAVIVLSGSYAIVESAMRGTGLM
jgi:hypothetical protein